MLHALAFALALQPVPSPSPSISPAPAPGVTPSPAPSITPIPAVLAVTPATVEMNPAQQRTLTVGGATGALQASMTQHLVAVAIDQGTQSVKLTASGATGSDTLTIVDATGASVSVPVRVALNAGSIVPEAALNVTGSPVDPVWLAQQVSAYVARLTKALPGTNTTIAPVAPPASPLPAGTRMQIAVPVQIAGNGTFFDQSGVTNVNVNDVAVSPFVPTVLYYDDDPEHLTQSGVAFRALIAPTQPARLYYYHDNAGDARHLSVVLESDAAHATSVQVIDASAGPNIDVMSVGHAVTKNFLLMQPRNQGVIVDLAPGESYTLHDLPLAPKDGVAGTVDVRVLSGGPVNVSVVATLPGEDPRSFALLPPLPDDGHHRGGAFVLSAFGNTALTYTVGGNDVHLVYGDRDGSVPPAPANPNGHDYGDYGVMRGIAFTVSNPTDTPSNAYLYERPIGGIVRSSFLIDGSLVELGCVKRSVPYQIAAYALPPHSTYHVLVQTMTDGGSNYPLEVGISATPPQPSTPPISAPDGCFPKASSNPVP